MLDSNSGWISPQMWVVWVLTRCPQTESPSLCKRQRPDQAIQNARCEQTCKVGAPHQGWTTTHPSWPDWGCWRLCYEIMPFAPNCDMFDRLTKTTSGHFWVDMSAARRPTQMASCKCNPVEEPAVIDMMRMYCLGILSGMAAQNGEPWPGLWPLWKNWSSPPQVSISGLSRWHNVIITCRFERTPDDLWEQATHAIFRQCVILPCTTSLPLWETVRAWHG